MARVEIVVSAVVLTDDRGRILTVRKRGTQRFMLPGGKPEAGESALAAAVRECAEELRVELAADSLRELGVYAAPAANEADTEVRATVFEHPQPWQLPLAPAAEIVELRWLDPGATLPDDLAPLLREQVLPALRD